MGAMLSSQEGRLGALGPAVCQTPWKLTRGTGRDSVESLASAQSHRSVCEWWV